MGNKTEITQQNYVDFLNCLNFDQVVQRYVPGPEESYTLQGNWPNVNTPDPLRGMANLSWEDLTSYLDWAALRPLTELEFEKTCRGPNASITGEYAWGNTTISEVTAKINPSCETASNIGEEGVCNFSDNSSGVGTLRVGFLGTASSIRTTIGASYYGALELSGNVFEQTVTVLGDGVNYDGTHGDGVISSDGQANVSSWPAYAGNGHTYKGGALFNGAVTAQVSMRYFVFITNHDRFSYVGGRGAR